jgi:hypothetical protein
MSLWVRPTADRTPRFLPVPDTALSKQSEQVSGPTHTGFKPAGPGHALNSISTRGSNRVLFRPGTNLEALT